MDLVRSLIPHLIHHLLGYLKERVHFLLDFPGAARRHHEPIEFREVRLTHNRLPALLASEFLEELPAMDVAGAHNCAEKDDEFVQVLGAY